MGLDANTKFLCHFDGADGAQVFTDATGNHSITAHGAAAECQTDTAQKKFGVSSLFLDDTDGDQNSGWLSMAGHADFYFTSSASFTWECFFRADHTTGNNVIFGLYNDNSDFCFINLVGGTFQWFARQNGGEIVNSSAGSPSINTWYHLAMIQKASVGTGVYFDGTQIIYHAAFAQDIGDFGIGAYATNGYYPYGGWIDEMRINAGNPYNATPVVGLTDTIVVPTRAFGTYRSPNKVIFTS